jgi:hypothetical protein
MPRQSTVFLGVENLKKKDGLVDLHMDGRIILKMSKRMGLDSINLVQ